MYSMSWVTYNFLRTRHISVLGTPIYTDYIPINTNTNLVLAPSLGRGLPLKPPF